MDPNTWAVLSALVALVALSNGLLSRTMRSEIGRLDEKIDHRVDGLEKRLDDKIDTKVDGLETRLNQKIDGLEKVVDVRLGALEGDMALVKAHLLGVDRAS